MPIDFDIRTVFNERSIYILHKVTPLDLLAQVAGSLGDNRRLYSALRYRPAQTQSLAPYNYANHPNVMVLHKLNHCVPLNLR